MTNEINDEKFTTELEELLPLIEELKSFPRQRPRLIFELRMWLYSFSPNFAARVIERRRESRDGPRRGVNTTRNRVLRSSACVALGCLLALGIFAGLIAAGRNSRPGDSLYFTKRISEKVELTFTWGNTDKADKQIAFARQKLSYLEDIARDSERSSEVVVSTVNEYRDNVRSAGRLLQATGSIPGEEKVVANLESLKAQEKKVMDRVTTAKPGSFLAAASLARVEVIDSSGKKALGPGENVIRSSVDEAGAFAFDALIDKDSRTSDLEVTVALDGRTASLPLFLETYTNPDNTSFQVALNPEASVLQVGRPITFTATIKDGKGAPLKEKEVRIRDRSNTGTIDGANGEVRLATDLEGRFDFTFNKCSVARVSRLSAQLLDGTWHELGDILVVGGVESPGYTPKGNAVTATTTTNEEGATIIELDNGLVHLTIDSGNPGHIITGMTCYGMNHVVGPMVDPAFTSLFKSAAIETSAFAKPFLFYADRDAAGYELSFDAPPGVSAESRIYRVMLRRDERFATIMCRVEMPPAKSAGNVDAQVVVPDMFLLEVPYRNADFELSGNTVRRPTGSEASTIMPFLFSDPFSQYKVGDANVAFAIPAESLVFPDSWSISTKGIGVRRSIGTIEDSNFLSLTSIVGFTDGLKTDPLIETALGARKFPVPDYLTGGAIDGAFLVTTAKEFEKSRKDVQRIELRIYKTYETLVDDR